MQITGATAALTTHTPQQYSGSAKLAGDNDGDGRKGAAALSDGDAASRRANAAIARTAQPATSHKVDVKA